ncbi:MAG: hypothetical protein Fur0037_22190 [Planctomycetota bacterium]
MDLLRNPAFPAILLAASCASPPALSTAFTWRQQQGSFLELARNGETVWRLCYGPDRQKPCFHPLALPGGLVLTADRPADHPWHCGL